MRGNIFFRSMELEDLQDIIEIEKLSFNDKWSVEFFCKELVQNRHAHYRVISVDNQIVGYCGCWLVLDESEITTISIHPLYRGCGLGEAILRHMIERMIELHARKMFLEVRFSNQSAQHLYKKVGFRQISIRKNYYADNQEDAIVMEMNLNEIDGRFTCSRN